MLKNKNFKTALFVAWRHLFSKKRHSLVNIISIISAVGVLSGTAALIIVLSVYNGIGEITKSLFNMKRFFRFVETRLIASLLLITRNIFFWQIRDKNVLL